eukprot:3880652-Pyramimonas_sp.AAC.1
MQRLPRFQTLARIEAALRDHPLRTPFCVDEVRRVLRLAGPKRTGKPPPLHLLCGVHVLCGVRVMRMVRVRLYVDVCLTWVASMCHVSDACAVVYGRVSHVGVQYVA